MSGFSITSAPSLPSPTSIASQVISNAAPSSISVGVSTPQFLSSNVSTNLSLSSISAPSINITSPIASAANLNLSGIGSSMGIPSSLPPPGQALNTLTQGLGVNTTNLSQAFAGNVSSMIPSSLKLEGLQFPKLPEFPGIDMAGINLGAGPKFIAEQIAKYKTIVPPFVPGLKINMGMALAAVSILKAAASGGAGELVKHLLDGIVSDLKSQVAGQINSAIDSTGINNVQGQLNGVIGDAKNSFIDQYNQNNPPQTTTDEEGNVVEIPSPPPDVSGFPDVKITPPEGTGILQSATTAVQNTTNNVLSQAKAFTFPPNG